MATVHPPTNSAIETKLAALLVPIFPDLTSVTLLSPPIVQQSAVGYRCVLSNEQRIFVKHIDAALYCAQKSDWPDLRRALIYARTEARFYAHFLPRLPSTIAPRVHHASTDLSSLVEDEESVTGAYPRSMPSVAECEGKGGLIVLDLVDDNVYFQASPLSLAQSKQCLAALAALHRAAWDDKTLLDEARKRLSVATFHLKLRNPKEMAGMEGAWQRFRGEFKDFFPEELWLRSEDLGRRLKKAAGRISDELSATARTLVHGDAKAMNAFLERRGDGAPLVDFAAVGVGNPMVDVAMHIRHAVLAEDLAGSQEADVNGEIELLDFYLNALGVDDYPKHLAFYHYKLAFCDYARFFLGRMWSNATVESMRRNESNPNVNSINRYPSSAIAFIDTADLYLSEIEKRWRASRTAA